MKSARLLSGLIFLLLNCTFLLAQTGESQFKYIIINKDEKRIAPPPGSPESLPSLTWVTPPASQSNTDFPIYEISGTVRSETSLTGLTVFVNGKAPEDNKTFLVLPTEKGNEFRISRNIMLNEGLNEIKIESRNQNGTSLSETRSVYYNITRINGEYSEKRLALVIGNSDYSNAAYLQNPVNDANSVAQALTDVGFTVLKYLNADQKTLKKAMDDFGEKLKKYTIGLFYYAGHGIQVKGINYLIPVDAALKVEQDVEYDCIDAGRILGKMEAAGTSTNIVILDACRNNPFERSWSTRSSGQGSGLAFMNAPSGSLIAYATSPGKTASDGTGRNGLYTEAILKFIKVPGMPIEEFFKNVRSLVETNSNREQTPWESTSLKGNFYFKIK